MGIMALVVLVLVEVSFFIWSVISKHSHRPEKCAARVAELVLLVILLLTGVMQGGFRYFTILIVLSTQAILGVVTLLRKREKPYALKRAAWALAGSAMLFLFALLPAILFPQYKAVAVTGRHTVATADYVWTDPDRVETFTAKEANRNVDVALWYPEEAGQYPLVMFSHGAFGFNLSNESTFVELASNGYVVASIGHPYHAFYTQDESGKPVIADMGFIQSVLAVNAMEDGAAKQAIIDGWMDLRLADERFVLDTIAEGVARGADGLFGKIDLDRIGLFGHSLGGAAAAQLGRERPGIDAVIGLDGTMLGETLGYDEDGTALLNDEPYPVPLLNVYSASHYRVALDYGDQYPNLHAANRAARSYAVIIGDAGHLNFTDLPLFSPLLARLLGVGTVDARYAIESTNAAVLAFFDYALKGGPEPPAEREC